ncbi:uncharacterized protein V3H82_018764 [Fundulus diaphanus]
MMEKSSKKRRELKRPWDTCREVPFIEDERTPWKLLKLLNIISLLAVAIIIFGLAVCSKASFLLLITLSHEGTKTLRAEQKPVTLLCIGCSLIAPSVLLLLKSIWKACYKSSKLPKKASAALVLFFEFIVSGGLAVLTIVAMPHLDIVTNVTILNGVAVLSAFLQAVAQCAAKGIKIFLLPSIIAFLVILIGYSLFLILYILKDPTNVNTAIWVGLAVCGSILVSFNWWENYFRVICVKSKSKFLKNLFEDLTKCQNMLHILSSLLRIVVTACVLGAYIPLAKMDWDVVTSIPHQETKIVVIIIGVQLISSALCHWFALTACKMHAIRRCFILPLYLASLAVIALFIVPVITYYQEHQKSLNTTENSNFTSYCAVAVHERHQSLSGNLFPQLVLDVTRTLCFLDMSKTADIGLLSGAAASWWIGLVLTTIHIWYLNTFRIQKTQDLFVRRLYEGAFIEQSLLLNTRFDIRTKKGWKKQKDATPSMVYLCATMWHETYEEMVNIMISVFRLDQYRPKILTQPKFDDFTFEAHIYFDDAFTNVQGSQDRHLNTYAKDLVKIIADVYGIFKNLDKSFFQVQQQILDQTIIKTPYGARLVVEMPHGNNIVVHFKDKELIRNKKRWSQVMYLYYLLGWKLMTKYYRHWQEGQHEKDLREKIQKEKHNTFLLALDGDTDFQPAAVMMLIDRLKMYPRVGAACGRIHPTGSGPAVWFQKFEYAVSHWLQKSAEHVFGCVLCSPGCFSLFRAEALMDDNVMKKYSTKSTEPSHYIQYDQGEDRWLCTLLLKQGWRVEYNAASDAYTKAPEDFKELYNQRKRWGPSTMANIVDLLGSTTMLSKRNPSMSKPFMFYQLFSIISSILAPSTICLMIAGSLSFLFDINGAGALVIAVIPPAIYLGLCFKLKPDTQITIAAVLSAMYAILMMVVSLSIIATMVRERTILTPSSIFIVGMSIIYIVTALMHPQELSLLSHGFLYIICVPSAYLLLTIYSMVNMNNVSWGTRETKPAAGAATTDEDQFWKELIEKYLEPLQNDKEKQEKAKNDLQELRNKINFSFFFLNALWLVGIFIIQVFDIFAIQINTVDMNLNETGGKIQIEPISLMFILGFALSVLLQFIGMLYHRLDPEESNATAGPAVKQGTEDEILDSPAAKRSKREQPLPNETDIDSRNDRISKVLFFEFIVSGGLAVLTIVAMPHLDIVTNVTILNGVAVLSAFLQAVAQCAAKGIKIFLLPSIIAFLVILIGYSLFLILYILKDPTNVNTAIWVGLAVCGSILVSFNWWENYFRVICVKSKSKFLKNLFEDLTKCQNMLHILSSLLRIVVTACVLGAYIPLAKMDWDVVTSIPHQETKIVVIIIGVQLISSALCHWFALTACKMHAIRRCFILPLYLASLAVIALFIVPVITYYQEHQKSLNTTENSNFTSYCAVAVHERHQSLSGNLFPQLVLDVTRTLCFLDMSKTADIGLLSGAAASWWIGLVLTTIHIWYLNTFRIQKTQDLFVRRLYEGAFIEQSLLLNTRFDIRTKKGWKKHPGCFSLFRAEALMDDNVMKKYSTKSTEPSHYIQYDQGEDRWLCTLLLKQGWRVEYNAASDAYTNAPENFKELYNQVNITAMIGFLGNTDIHLNRKRWGPSTMANVVDLLGSTNIVSKRNLSMSKPFMFYQLFAMISAILAPATICLMVAGSLSFLFDINAAGALVIAVIPPAIYLGLCFKLKPDTQITIAAILSVMYAFLMVVVSISIIASMVKEKTILTPSSIFIVAVSIIYIVTALMHPQELHLVFYGFLYIICIPSAYLLLTIYSMEEENFWNEFIKMYLEPVKDDIEKQKKTQNDLQELRNKVIVKD